MEKSAHHKSKNKKTTIKPKTAKKRKSDGIIGPTCSMFLAEYSRKLAKKKKQEEECPKNIVQKIIESITNALPVKFSKRSPSKKESPMKIESLQTYAPELMPNHIIDIPHSVTDYPNFPNVEEPVICIETSTKCKGFKIPKMPLVNSDVFKQSDKRTKVITEDTAVNTGPEHDVASEITKYIGTLRKISLIAEEFNQKTAKSLKEIVDSVQEDLLKKLEEVQAEQRTSKSEKQLSINYKNELLQ